MEPLWLTYTDRPSLAYVYTPPAPEGDHLPHLMFLGGYRSDMEGTKAHFLEERCRARGQGYIRFDYRGHGRSKGRFEEATIGEWRDDALAVLDTLPEGPVLLAGSSMGGWIAMLCALARPERVQGLVGIAPAPDFLEDMVRRLTDAQRSEISEQGFTHVANDYSPESYVLTDRLIREAREHHLLEETRRFPCPYRLLQGMQDNDVPWPWALQILNRLAHEDKDLVLIEDGEHRMSRPQDLELIDGMVMELSLKITGFSRPEIEIPGLVSCRILPAGI